AIAGDPGFTAYGFAERAGITQCCLAAGWALFRARRMPRLARALLALGLFRFVWFDLLVLNPVAVPQAVGPLPLLNLATIHTALAAAWFWTLPDRSRRTRMTAAALTAVAALATVRQLAHGSILTGTVTTAENW